MKHSAHIQSLLFRFCILICCLSSCKKETSLNESLTPSPVLDIHAIFPSSTDGFGFSTKPITGNSYTFPPGVILNDSITTNINACTNALFYECMTDGNLPFYMSLRNNNSLPSTVIFPAGLVIPSTDTITQNAIIVQPSTFTIPANTTICVNLNALCINDHRTFSSNKSYGKPILSNNHNFIPLFKLLAKKQTITNDPTEVIQHAVWNIADSGAMTPADIAAVNAFP